MAVLSPHVQLTLALISITILSGTIYSYQHNTFLDTSNPLLAHLPHPASASAFFANKKNLLNQLFVKKSWGWTSLVFWLVWATAPAESGVRDLFSIGRWVGATLVWTTFAGWFFGPSLFQRIGALSGMQCVVVLPPESADAPHTQTILSIPAQFCSTKTPISPATHPALFAHPPLSLDAAEAHFPRMPVWRGDLKGFVPRFYRGHDVSGHTFLLTLSVLFLVDHLVRARRLRVGARGTAVQSGNEWTPLRLLGLIGGWALVGLWMVMLGATAVYFHTWEEKLSGFLIAVAGYVISQYPFDAPPIPTAQDVPPVVITKID